MQCQQPQTVIELPQGGPINPIEDGRQTTLSPGTHILAQIDNPIGFPGDLLVSKEDLDQGKIIGNALSSWLHRAGQKNTEFRDNSIELEKLDLAVVSSSPSIADPDTQQIALSG